MLTAIMEKPKTTLYIRRVKSIGRPPIFISKIYFNVILPGIKRHCIDLLISFTDLSTQQTTFSTVIMILN